jgi:uncharacterized protein (DUF1330 family)
MAKGYVILTEAVHDPDGMRAYGESAATSLAEHRPAVLVVDNHVEVLEGEWHGNATIVLEFESVEAARKWYHSESYQAARSLRQAAADCNVIIASGFTPPQTGASSG